MHGVFLEKNIEKLQKSLDFTGLLCYSFMALRRQQVKFCFVSPAEDINNFSF